MPSGLHYHVNLEKGEVKEGLLLDTFDNELFSSGRLLLQVGRDLVLKDLRNGNFTEQKSSGDWSFIAELESGPVAIQLKKISRLRALIPVAAVKVRKETGLILDDEGKTRVRFKNLIFSVGKKTAGVGSTQHLRGYDQAHEDLKNWLTRLGAVRCHTATDLYAILGISVEYYTAKPVIQLNPETTVKKSATSIISTYLSVARRNENGVVADYDTEFLHDYRVSLRKVRSVLSLFSGAYGGGDVELLKNEFAKMMQKTNKLRDLDVYLLERERYFEMVPKTTHEGLEVLFEGFAKDRREEHKKVSAYITGKTYQSQIGRLEKLFGKAANFKNGENSKEDSCLFGCQLILKRYARVCKIARAIDKTTEDEVVHKLRIQCKKLRYLMEFFTPFFPEAEIKMLIKSLKQLQDNLGRFNDYSVQQQFLKNILTGNITHGGKGIKVAESIGALTAMLYRLQRKERGLVMKNFIFFDSPKIRASFNELFTIEESANEDYCLL